MKKIITLGLLGVLCACENSGGQSASNNGSSDIQTETSTQWKYQFEINGCDTGEHSFTLKTELCEALKDDNLNNFCAFSARREYFTDLSCIGTF